MSFRMMTDKLLEENGKLVAAPDPTVLKKLPNGEVVVVPDTNNLIPEIPAPRMLVKDEKGDAVLVEDHETSVTKYRF